MGAGFGVGSGAGAGGAVGRGALNRFAMSGVSLFVVRQGDWKRGRDGGADQDAGGRASRR
ncbi:hypothetical protein Sp245p_03275 [Azospirillum baldaniorum]|nr:hypothetical protein Sp245p_03275 [Azospirillum baldaniorum]